MQGQQPEHRPLAPRAKRQLHGAEPRCQRTEYLDADVPAQFMEQAGGLALLQAENGGYLLDDLPAGRAGPALFKVTQGAERDADRVRQLPLTQPDSDPPPANERSYPASPRVHAESITDAVIIRSAFDHHRHCQIY